MESPDTITNYALFHHDEHHVTNYEPIIIRHVASLNWDKINSHVTSEKKGLLAMEIKQEITNSLGSLKP